MSFIKISKLRRFATLNDLCLEPAFGDVENYVKGKILEGMLNIPDKFRSSSYTGSRIRCPRLTFRGSPRVPTACTLTSLFLEYFCGNISV